MSLFVKDIAFPAGKMLEKETLRDLMLTFATTNVPTFWRFGSLLVHCKRGAQIWISREVSDDLLASDIDEPDFASLEWPHDTLEFYFEDQDIPTFLLQKGGREQLRDDICRYLEWDKSRFQIAHGTQGYGSGTRLIDLLVETKDHAVASVTYSDEHMNHFASGDDVPDIPKLGVDHHEKELDPEEKDELSRLALLAFKVLLFCNSEGLKPRETMEAPTKKQGGKPGFRARPRTKRMIVEYLPRQRSERKQEAQKLGGTHAFLGRRGHWRTYRHDRYVNKQGTRWFILPVPGPDGTVPRRRFKVVK